MYKEIQAFLDYMRESDDYSRNTYLSYKRILLKLAEFIGHQTDVKTIRKNHLQDYINSLPKEFKGNTVNNHIYIIRLFFKFLLEYDYIEGDVSSVLKTKDQILNETEIIESDTFVKLSSFNLKDILDYRDKAIILLLYNTGGMASEILTLRVKDYDNNKKTVTYIRDTGTRTLELDNETSKIIDKYLSMKNEYSPDSIIFYTKNNIPLTHRRYVSTKLSLFMLHSFDSIFV